MLYAGLERISFCSSSVSRRTSLEVPVLADRMTLFAAMVCVYSTATLCSSRPTTGARMRSLLLLRALDTSHAGAQVPVHPCALVSCAWPAYQVLEKDNPPRRGLSTPPPTRLLT